MDRLPVEIVEMIFDKVLRDNPEELYRLRTVSRTWRIVAERSGSRVFKYWYNRCQKEIPEDHLTDIVQTKYPLVAYPWQEFYWVDSRLPHVAKNAYTIWKSLPNLNDEIDRTECKTDFPLEPYSIDCTVGTNDKYFAVYSYYGDGEPWGTWIFQWNNLYEEISHCELVSQKIDFYSTEKGTFIILAQYHETDKDLEIFISKYPIDKRHLPFGLFSLGHVNKYFITQNECFYATAVDDSTHPITLEHKILTERGFKTNTIIEIPAGIPEFSWENTRVEISDCALYVMHDTFRKSSIIKYKISRNSDDGKLSFTLKEFKISNDHDNGALQSQNCSLFHDHFSNRNLDLAKVEPWRLHVSRRNIYPLAVYANYVICVKRIMLNANSLCIFQKDNLIECVADNNFKNLKYTFTDIGISVKGIPVYCQIIDIHDVSIIYIGLKAKLLVSYNTTMCLMDFY